MKRIALAAVALVVLAFAACNGTDEPQTVTPPAYAPPTYATQVYAPAPTYPDPPTYSPETAVDDVDVDAPKVRVHSGRSGHPCLPGERDGDKDGFCGEGK